MYTPNQVQDLVLGFAELHEAGISPPIMATKVPLDGIPSLQYTNHTTHLGVVTRLAQSHCPCC